MIAAHLHFPSTAVSLSLTSADRFVCFAARLIISKRNVESGEQSDSPV